MLKKLIIAISSLVLSATYAFGEKSLTAYFKNDSVNGLMISDAYETHNMGLTYRSGRNYAGIDLGIVSPDMHLYKNQYREANRSFGEIISLEFGHQLGAENNIKLFGKLRGSGKFGLDKTQEFAHRLLSLQSVSDINQLVRMPNKLWYGVGGEYASRSPLPQLSAEHSLQVMPYFGTDRASVKSELEFLFPYHSVSLSSALSLEYVLFDRIVSAKPISATPRKLIPQLSFGAAYDFGRFSVFAVDSFALPTIQKDQRIFGVLHAGITYNF